MLTEIAISGAALAAAVTAGYHAMAPESQLYGATVTRVGDPRAMALTYDDGPNDPYTLRMLEVLARHGAKATFFMIGKYVQQRPEIVREVVRAGHGVGNHTWDHPNLIFCSPREVARQLRDCSSAITDACGVVPTLFRPPFGGRTPWALKAARGLGMTPVMWNVTGFDWSATTGEAIEQRVVKQVARNPRGGEIILLHDGGHKAMGADRAHSVDATERILARFAGEREFVGVSGGG